MTEERKGQTPAFPFHSSEQSAGFPPLSKEGCLSFLLLQELTGALRLLFLLSLRERALLAGLPAVFSSLPVKTELLFVLLPASAGSLLHGTAPAPSASFQTSAVCSLSAFPHRKPLNRPGLLPEPSFPLLPSLSFRSTGGSHPHNPDIPLRRFEFPLPVPLPLPSDPLQLLPVPLSFPRHDGNFLPSPENRREALPFSAGLLRSAVPGCEGLPENQGPAFPAFPFPLQEKTGWCPISHLPLPDSGTPFHNGTACGRWMSASAPP